VKTVSAAVFSATFILFSLGGIVGAADAGEEPSPVQKVPESVPAELVLVAGATGGAGREIVGELLASGYRVRAFVRDAARARASFADQVEYAVGDVRERATIDAALDGVDALISAVGGMGSDPDNGPEFVDFGGVRNMAEAAAAAHLRQFVLVSSMGVTHEDNVLNQMFDNVLIWKFRGEQALRASGVPYTIIRPGGLVDEPGGEKAIVFSQGDNSDGKISRADLARVCVAALGSPDALNKTFEISSGKFAPARSLAESFAALAADPPAGPHDCPDQSCEPGEDLRQDTKRKTHKGKK